MQAQLFEDPALPNPKRESKIASLSTYDYYAGFSEKFVEKVLTEHQKDCIRILDPWNGAGTTTNCASRLSIRSCGVDLNPVMTIISQASCSATSRRAIANATKLIQNCQEEIATSDNDPLLHWFSRKSVQAIRSLLASAFNNDTGMLQPNRRISNATAPLILFCIFSQLKHSFKASPHKSSNPTWIRKGTSAEELIEISQQDLIDSTLHHLAMLKISAPPQAIHSKYIAPNIFTADSRSMPFADGSFDLVITSPPYCTRIDYAVKTSIEYATAFGSKGFDELRRKLIGTTTVESKATGNLDQIPYCKELLEKIRLHDSKASHTYYYKNVLQYFVGLHKSIQEIARVLRRGGECYLVVQDSFYKDILISLGTATQELCSSAGLQEIKTSSFQVAANLGNINSASRKYRQQNSINEHVLHVRRK